MTDYDLSALTSSLPLYTKALHKPVREVIQIGSILCCRLADGLIVGAQFAVEHGELEVLLMQAADLPEEFRQTIEPHPMGEILRARRFRGFVLCVGDLGFDFGDCILRFVKSKSMAVLLDPKDAQRDDIIISETL